MEERNTQTDRNPYLYTGKEQDIMTGLYYYEQRYYDPNKSTFLGVDPLAEKAYFISPYAYCFNNPIKLVDPDGLSPGDPFSDFINAVSLWIAIKQAKNKEDFKSACTTIAYMKPPTNNSKGEDLISMKVGYTIDLEVASLGVVSEFALNEDKGPVQRFTASSTLGPYDAKIVTEIYQDDAGKTKYETKVSDGFLEPSLDLPIEAGGGAILRNVTGVMETITNYINQKFKDATNQNDRIPDEYNNR